MAVLDKNNVPYKIGDFFFYPKGAGRSAGIVKIHKVTRVVEADRVAGKNTPYLVGRVVGGEKKFDTGDWETSENEKPTTLFYPHRGIIINQELVNQLQEIVNGKS